MHVHTAAARRVTIYDKSHAGRRHGPSEDCAHKASIPAIAFGGRAKAMNHGKGNEGRLH